LEYELTGTVNVGYSSNPTFGNLPAGNYIVNVRDSKLCTSSSVGVVLDAPLPILLTASANVLSVNLMEIPMPLLQRLLTRRLEAKAVIIPLL
jgi:hypothetical protein